MVTNSKNKTPKNKKAIRNKLLTNNISDDSSIYKDTKKLRTNFNTSTHLEGLLESPLLELG